MKWFDDLFRKKEILSDESLIIIQKKFKFFLNLLHNNYFVLRHLSDIEEKLQGEYLFDLNYVRSVLSEIRTGMSAIIENIINLGGTKYKSLKDIYQNIDSQIAQVLPGGRIIEKDDFTKFFKTINKNQAFSVGSKNAQLGEMKTSLGLPVPDGFAITAWAYKHFITSNNLQQRISDLISSLNIKKYDDLQKVSQEIRKMIMDSPIPEDLALTINGSYQELRESNPDSRFALRSSALGEDTEFSFAGQYRSILNVRARELLDSYREILASKFTPQAIYYFMSHSISEDELAMCVGCIVMINAKASGVIYTRDPVYSDDDAIVVNAIPGLGKYLVDGTVTPDVYRVSRAEKAVIEALVSNKTHRLDMHPDGGTVDNEIPAREREKSSLTHDKVIELAKYAVKLEEHYGCPQDIEWALDQDDKIHLLQTRPLRIISSESEQSPIDLSDKKIIAEGGITICPGAGSGPIYRIKLAEDLINVPDGVILVTPSSFPGIVTVMGKINGLIAESGGMASHMATIAREYRLPAIGNFKYLETLEDGIVVTIDSTTTKIYDGVISELTDIRKPETGLFDDTDIINILKQIASHITPLNMIDPRGDDFVLENCKTFHDITRFSHQKAMDEMFFGASELKNKEKYSLKLKTDIPLKVNMIFIDREMPFGSKDKWIDENNIESVPMTAFWNGLREIGWPSQSASVDMKGFLGVLATSMTRSEEGRFAENSFAILSKEYMVLSLRMGYHFSTIETMVSDEINKNYIRLEFKDGGATIERRIRRIKLLVNVLSKMGFESYSKGDFLDAKLSYTDADKIEKALTLLGKLTVMTKQLDMALSNDKIAQWYTNDFIKRLGLEANED